MKTNSFCNFDEIFEYCQKSDSFLSFGEMNMLIQHVFEFKKMDQKPASSTIFMSICYRKN